MRTRSWFQDLVTVAGGFSLLGGTLFWLIALVERLVLRRQVSFGEWFTHGVAVGALVGGLAWAIGLLP